MATQDKVPPLASDADYVEAILHWREEVREDARRLRDNRYPGATVGVWPDEPVKDKDA